MQVSTNLMAIYNPLSQTEMPFSVDLRKQLLDSEWGFLCWVFPTLVGFLFLTPHGIDWLYGSYALVWQNTGYA